MDCVKNILKQYTTRLLADAKTCIKIVIFDVDILLLQKKIVYLHPINYFMIL